MFLGVNDIKAGMILNYQSETWPDKKSRWIVLEELRDMDVDGKRFKIYCIQCSMSEQSGVVNEATNYVLHRGNIHRFTVHSQI